MVSDCTCVAGRSSDCESFCTDDRWLDWLDSKVALLINRDGIDVRDYGGKSYDEYAPPRLPCFGTLMSSAQ